MAEIDLGGTDILSSSDFQWAAFAPDVTDFNSLTWTDTATYGYNGALNNIWTSNNGNSPVAGISTDAQWVWADKKFSDLEYSHIFIKATIDSNPTPESAAMLLLGSGLVGLVGVRRRLKKS